jgi:ankyrin repeat protein
VNQATTTDGLTPIFIAAQHLQLSVVQMLLDRGAAVNQARNTDGTTPRFWEVQQGKLSMAQLLLNRGAVVNPVRVLQQQTYAFLERVEGTGSGGSHDSASVASSTQDTSHVWR